MDDKSNSPIPIAYVSSHIATENAGTEGHLLRLIRSLDRKKFRPVLVTLQRTPWSDALDDPLVPLHVMDFKSFMRPKDWSVSRRLADLFRSLEIQVAELHGVDAILAASHGAHLAKVPAIVSCRRDMGYFYTLKTRLMLKVANQMTTHFLANSGVVADRISELEGVPAESFHIIHNGLDVAAFDERAAGDVSPEFTKRTTGKRVVAIAANLRPVKDVATFVQATAHVAKEFDDVVFAIMGDGVERPELEQLSKDLGIADRTIFLGSVSNVPAILKRSHVGCLSSTSEGFSNSIIEYMTAGLPVVATDVGGNSEAISNGESGFVVPASDPKAFAERLCDVLKDESHRQQMGRSSRERVEANFTMQRQLDDHERFYLSSLSR